MLIREVQLLSGQQVDLLIDGSTIVEIAPRLEVSSVSVIEGQNGLLIPGLHDHHTHLMSLAASKYSVSCGPPDVCDENALVQRLRAAAKDTGGNWIRGVGYHETVAGSIDRNWLDRHIAEVPIRIQHRTGRLWILNSKALERVTRDAERPDGLECVDGTPTGRLYDEDVWLRSRLSTSPLNLKPVSAELASFGVTGVTDATVTNDRGSFELFKSAAEDGHLKQNVLLMGTAELKECQNTNEIVVGPTKFHLHENDLIPLDDFCRQIRYSHDCDRPIAVHCVTHTELVYTLAALRDGGVRAGDRIEHASVTSPALVAQIKEMGLTVVTQPNFVFERGDAYREEISAQEHDWLYRCAGFLQNNIPVGGGTDAPFGGPNPWLAMDAAVHRKTRSGGVLGPNESLSPEQALCLFTTSMGAPGGKPRCVAVGEKADLCLLTAPWDEVRQDLSASRVRATFKNGEQIFDADR